MNKNLFEQVSDRLESQVPELRWVDWDFGQLDNIEGRPNVAFPAALIDITYRRTDDQTDISQIVTAEISIRAAFKPRGATHSQSPVRSEALAVFEITDKIHAVLQGWKDATHTFSDLSRLNARSEKRRDGLKVYTITYETTFQETTAAP